MVYQERNTWSGIIVTLIAMTVYVTIVLQQADGGPVTDVTWWPIMLWTIGASIVGTIVLSIVWAILAGIGEPEGTSTSDVRDRDIERMGERVGHAFVGIAGLGVIVLCAMSADLFWIAHTMFFGFALSAFVGGIAQVIAYRRGLL